MNAVMNDRDHEAAVGTQIVERAAHEPRPEARVATLLVNLGVEQNDVVVPECIVDPTRELAVVPELVAFLGRVVGDAEFVRLGHPS
jgi:hypothetical protein